MKADVDADLLYILIEDDKFLRAAASLNIGNARDAVSIIDKNYPLNQDQSTVYDQSDDFYLLLLTETIRKIPMNDLRNWIDTLNAITGEIQIRYEINSAINTSIFGKEPLHDAETFSNKELEACSSNHGSKHVPSKLSLKL